VTGEVTSKWITLEAPRHVLVYGFVGVGVWYLTWRLGTFNPQAPFFSGLIYAAEVFGFGTALLHTSADRPPGGPRARGHFITEKHGSPSAQTTLIQRILDQRAQKPPSPNEGTTATVRVMLRVLPPPKALLTFEDRTLDVLVRARLTSAADQ
jgi:hypothetical protein